jgi:hypothetical protein
MKKLYFNFIFELACINNVRFHCDHCEHAHLSFIFLFPLPLSCFAEFGGFPHVSSYVYLWLTSLLCIPQYTFLCPSCFHWFFQTIFYIPYHHYYQHHFSLGCTNEQEYAIFGLFSLTFLTQHDHLHFHPFSCKWHNFTKKDCI